MLTAIKRVRTERGLLQYQIARRVGVTDAKMSKVETGRLLPDDKLLEKIAKVLDVAPTDLRPVEVPDEG